MNYKRLLDLPKQEIQKRINNSVIGKATVFQIIGEYIIEQIEKEVKE